MSCEDRFFSHGHSDHICKFTDFLKYNTADECYISANGTVKFPLPYKKGTAQVYADETFESFTGVQNLWNYSYTAERKRQLYEAYLARGGKPVDECKNLISGSCIVVVEK